MSMRSAFAWSLAERATRQGIQFAIGIVLARLLAPADYGLVGMMAVFLALGNVLANAGLGMALVQRADLTAEDQTSAFYLNCSIGGVMAVVICMAAPFIAKFYAQPPLQELVQVASLQVLLTSVGVVPAALLTRALDFKSQAVVSIGATLVSGIAGIALALTGYGVWSLVWQGLIACGSSSAMIWVVSRWRPAGQPSWRSIQRLWNFSANSLASGTLFVVFENIYPLLIGRFYSPAAVGLYSRAQQLQTIPSNIVADVVGRVTFPRLSGMQDDKLVMKSTLRRYLALLAAVYFPAMVCLAADADTLIPFLLTDKWSDAVPLFRVLCFAGMFYPVNALIVSAINAQGRADIVLRLELVKKVLLIGILAGTVPLGIQAMAWGTLVQYFACSLLNVLWGRRASGYTMGEFLGDLAPFLVIAVACAAGPVYLVSSMEGAVGAKFAAQSILQAACVVALAVTFRRGLYREVWRLCGVTEPRLAR
jgi:teichuronic acid exporter